MIKDMDRDEQALLLREHGRSFVEIAEALGLDSVRAANASFNRALRGARGSSRSGCVRARWRVSMPWRPTCAVVTT